MRPPAPPGPRPDPGGEPAPTPELAELVRYYGERYARPPGALRDYRLYLRLAEARPGERLLDVGCGEGFVLEAAGAAGVEAAGVEIVEAAIRLARGRAPGAALAVAAGEALPFRDGSFDLVSFIGTLEHFADPAAGVREAARVLRPGGRALVVVPNRRFVGWLLKGRAGTEQREVSELLLDEEGWRGLLEAAGLEVVRAAKEPWYTRPMRTRLHALALRAAWRLIPRRWTYQFAFLCRRPG